MDQISSFFLFSRKEKRKEIGNKIQNSKRSEI